MPAADLRDALLAKVTSDWDYDYDDEYERARRALLGDLDALIAAATAEARAGLVDALRDLTAYPFSFDNWGCRDCQLEMGHSARCRVGKAIAALAEPEP